MSIPSPFEALSRQQLIDRLEKEVWASAIPVIAQQLANQLMTTMDINPQGVNLVMWFAGPGHHCNSTALTEWVGRQMGDPFFQKATSHTPPLEVLARLITQKLEAAEAANS